MTAAATEEADVTAEEAGNFLPLVFGLPRPLLADGAVSFSRCRIRYPQEREVNQPLMPHTVNMIKYGALFGWGIVIYSVVFLVWSGFIAYGFVGGLAPALMAFLALIVVSVIAGHSLRLHSWKDVLPYSIAWAVMIAVLDAIFAVPFSGWGIYLEPNVLMGYFLVITVPLFTCDMTILSRD